MRKKHGSKWASRLQKRYFISAYMCRCYRKSSSCRLLSLCELSVSFEDYSFQTLLSTSFIHFLHSSIYTSPIAVMNNIMLLSSQVFHFKNHLQPAYKAYKIWKIISNQINGYNGHESVYTHCQLFSEVTCSGSLTAVEWINRFRPQIKWTF